MAYKNYKSKNWKTPTPSAKKGTETTNPDVSDKTFKQPQLKVEGQPGVVNQVSPTANTSVAIFRKQKDNTVPGFDSSTPILATILKRRN